MSGTVYETKKNEDASAIPAVLARLDSITPPETPPNQCASCETPASDTHWQRNPITPIPRLNRPQAVSPKRLTKPPQRATQALRKAAGMAFSRKASSFFLL